MSAWKNVLNKMVPLTLAVGLMSTPASAVRPVDDELAGGSGCCSERPYPSPILLDGYSKRRAATRPLDHWQRGTVAGSSPVCRDQDGHDVRRRLYAGRSQMLLCPRRARRVARVLEHEE